MNFHFVTSSIIYSNFSNLEYQKDTGDENKIIVLDAVHFFIPTFAQVYKYHAYSFSIRYDNGNYWTDWSEPRETEILISINLSENVIKIYSEEQQTYDIIEYHDEESDENGNKHIRMYCEDADGQNCNVDLVKRGNGDERLQMYVRYSDMQWVYDIEK